MRRLIAYAMSGMRPLWAVSALLALPCLSLFADEKEKFPVEVEKPLAELVKKAVELRSSTQMEELKKAITDIADTTKMGDDAKKRLETEAKAVVERSLDPWKEKLDAKLRPFLRQDIKESLELMTQWPAEMLIKNSFVPESGKIAEQEDWKNALKKILAPEQLAFLEKQALDRDQALEKEIQESLKPSVALMQKSTGLLYKSEVSDLKSVLGLKGERAKKFDDLAEEAAKHKADEMEKQWTEEMRKMTTEARAQFTMRRGRGRQMFSTFNTEMTDASTVMESWKKTLRELLSEDEQKRWETASTIRQSSQNKAMAMLFLSQVDSMVLFSASQREKLEPLAMKVMATLSKSEKENFTFNPGYTSKFDQKELKLILDDKQFEHWQEVSKGEMGRRRMGMGEVEIDDQEKSTSDVDQDEDAIMSAFFHARDQRQRDRLAKGYLVKLEDIQRVAKPSEESIKRLEIASRGAAEHSLDNWRPNFENWVRSSMRNVNIKTIKQRLAGLNADVNFGEENTKIDDPIWSVAVADVLTDSQRELWMNEVIGRKRYLERAKVFAILAELDRRCHLNLDQLQKLEPLLTEAVTEYSADFNRMFGGSGIISRYLIVLLSGVPEESTKSILTPEQFEQWKNTDSAQFKGWWENIKSNHDSRNKAKKKK